MGMGCPRRTLITLLLTGVVIPVLGHSQSAEESKLADATAALHEFAQDPSTAIPHLLLQSAEGVAVIPDVIRGGFIFGGYRGKGVVVVRSENGEWSNPAFITLTGGSIGAQIGGDSTDVVLVFGKRRSVRNIAQGKFTLGSDVTATAGYLERSSRAATDMTFTAEVYSYARSRGLFAGAALEGGRLSMDAVANSNFYPPGSGAEPLGQEALATPASARRFLRGLEQSEATPGPTPQPTRVPDPDEEAVIYPLGND